MKNFLYQYSVPFQDTDMAGVVHYTCILGYAELAEHAFLCNLGISPVSKNGGFPKVSVECDYILPLRFADDVSIEISLVKYSARSIHWGFDITVNSEISARGKLITVYVDTGGKSCEMPLEWQRLLSE